jgi:hypothetical protein
MVSYAEQARNARYDHPSSVKHRAALTHKPAMDPVQEARARHRQEVADLGQRHRSEMETLQFASDQVGLSKRDRERALAAKHHSERQTLAKKHSADLHRIVERVGKRTP